MVRSGGYMRSEGVDCFSVQINHAKLPKDHPFSNESSGTWQIILEDILTKIGWECVEIGLDEEVIDLETDRKYETFEVFGVTNRDNACRIRYEEKSHAFILRSINGVIAGRDPMSVKKDVNDLREAFSKEDFYNFITDMPRFYP